MNRDTVIELVETRLLEVGPNFVFDVLKEGVRSEEDWWYVPVYAHHKSGQGLPREFVVSTFANVEDDLREKGANVLFIPYTPDALAS